MENKLHDGQPCTVKKGNMFSLHMIILLIVHSAWAWSSINIQEKKCHAFSIWMYIWAFWWCCIMFLLCLYFPPMSGEPYHSKSFKISVWSQWLYTESFSFFSFYVSFTKDILAQFCRKLYTDKVCCSTYEWQVNYKLQNFDDVVIWCHNSDSICIYWCILMNGTLFCNCIMWHKIFIQTQFPFCY